MGTPLPAAAPAVHVLNAVQVTDAAGNVVMGPGLTAVRAILHGNVRLIVQTAAGFVPLAPLVVGNVYNIATNAGAYVLTYRHTNAAGVHHVFR